MKKPILAILGLLAIPTTVAPLLAQTYNIPWHTIGPGGTSAGGALAVSGGGLNLAGGFWAFTGAQIGATSHYTVVDLGTLGGDGINGEPGSWAYALNNSGQIVGYSYTAGNASFRPVVWADSTSAPLALATLGGDNGEAYGINDLGAIVGYAHNTGNTQFKAAVWTNIASAPLELGGLGGPRTAAASINKSGQIVGFAYDPVVPAGGWHALYWASPNSGPVRLGEPGGSYKSDALWINDAGQIVGDAIPGPDPSAGLHATYWASVSSAAADLGTLGTLETYCYAMNNSGQIVGASDLPSWQAIFWPNSSSAGAYLATPGNSASEAYGINASGQIVGWAGDGAVHRAAIWTNSSSPAIDLNTLLPANSGWVLRYANAINDSGEIVGIGTINGHDRAFALTPVKAASGIAPLPAGIISWWRAENNALDSIGTNHGTLVNGATFAAGEVGQAFSLNGTSQSVDIPDAPLLRPASVTLEAWMMFNGGSGYRALVLKPLGSTTYDSYGIYLYNGTIVGFIGDGTPNQPNLSVALSPQPGRWYHVAYAFDNITKQQALYLDGAQVATGIANTSIAYDGHPVLLGRDIKYGSPALFFPGRIDEASIYSRALTAAEVASIYNAGPAGKQLPVLVGPTLSVHLTTTNTVLVSWPSPSTGFTLQQSTDLSPPNWVAVTNTLNDNGVTKSILVIPPVGNKFFRLMYP